LNDNDGLSLQDYWRVISKRKWIVILTVVVLTASAVTFSFIQVPIYEASTTLYLKKAKAGPEQIDIFGGVSLLSAETEINTQIEILKSHTVMEEVARRLFSPGRPKRWQRTSDNPRRTLGHIKKKRASLSSLRRRG